MHKTTLLYWRDGDFVVGRLRERADVFSQGRTLEELEVNIKDALAEMEATDLEDIPEDYQAKDIILEA